MAAQFHWPVQKSLTTTASQQLLGADNKLTNNWSLVNALSVHIYLQLWHSAHACEWT